MLLTSTIEKPMAQSSFRTPILPTRKPPPRFSASMRYSGGKQPRCGHAVVYERVAGRRPAGTRHAGLRCLQTERAKDAAR